MASVVADSSERVEKDEGETSTDERVGEQRAVEPAAARSALRTMRHLVFWVPPRCRYDPENPPVFTLGLNILFSLATTATVGNLYYNQPILYQMADTFSVTFERASAIATLMQAGYAGGLVLICPLGDILPRRHFILALVALTALVWIGLCVTTSFTAFAALSFVCGFTTVTPQLMLPLVGELAPPHRRATALAVVVSGLSLGMMVARLLSGIVANYTSWRNIYWVSLGAQGAVLASLYLYMPDYPTKKVTADMLPAQWTLGSAVRFTFHYIKVLYGGIIMLILRHATLVQACLIAFCMSAVFTSYWTTLSFLLASPPYSYPSYAIGLFGLIGIVVICLGPVYSRFAIEHMMPIVVALLHLFVEATGVAVGIGIGTFCVAGPIVQAVLVDVGNQASNIALRTSIYGLEPGAQNRVNSAYMIASFTGQLAGTSAGNRLYAMGGWRYSGGLALGLLGFAILVALARGPRETRWVGWRGGWPLLKDKVEVPHASAESRTERGENAMAPEPDATQLQDSVPKDKA